MMHILLVAGLVFGIAAMATFIAYPILQALGIITCRDCEKEKLAE